MIELLSRDAAIQEMFVKKCNMVPCHSDGLSYLHTGAYCCYQTEKPDPWRYISNTTNEPMDAVWHHAQWTYYIEPIYKTKYVYQRGTKTHLSVSYYSSWEEAESHLTNIICCADWTRKQF